MLFEAADARLLFSIALKSHNDIDCNKQTLLLLAFIMAAVRMRHCKAHREQLL